MYYLGDTQFALGKFIDGSVKAEEYKNNLDKKYMDETIDSIESTYLYSYLDL